jgi:hypothetical protein
VDPDLFITIVFVSWVAMFGAVGALVARRQQLSEHRLQAVSTVPIVKARPPENDPASPARHRGDELATEAERARTPRTPVLAFAGVWIVLAVVVVLIVTFAFIAYFAWD